VNSAGPTIMRSKVTGGIRILFLKRSSSAGVPRVQTPQGKTEAAGAWPEELLYERIPIEVLLALRTGASVLTVHCQPMFAQSVERPAAVALLVF